MKIQMKSKGRLCGNFLLIMLTVLLINQCKTNTPKTLVLFEESGTSWITGGDSKWTFENGDLVGKASGTAGFVMTKDRYKNFELEVEFYPDSTVNSGIFVRCSNKELSHTDCYEMNIWDRHPDQKSRTGAVVSRKVPGDYVETLDKWNTYKISCKGNHIKTWVNGKLTIDMKDEDLVEGFIALQAAETGTVKFRNVKLRLQDN